MHEYTKHQMSAADIADLREKRAAAGSKGGKAKASATANASPVAKQTPSKDVAEVEVEVEVLLSSKKESPVSNASADETNVYDITSETRSKAIKPDVWKVARAYAAKVNPSDPARVAAHMTNALATWDMTTIARAIAQMANDNRPVSADSLRVELNKIGCDKNGIQRFQDGTYVDWNTGIYRATNGNIIGGGGFRSNKPMWRE